MAECEWQEIDEKLLSDMSEWRKRYAHKKPCRDFQRYKHCRHLVAARYKKFRNRILGQIEMTLLEGGINIF